MNIFHPPAHFQDAITLSITEKKEAKSKEDKNRAVILHNMVNIA